MTERPLWINMPFNRMLYLALGGWIRLCSSRYSHTCFGSSHWWHSQVFEWLLALQSCSHSTCKLVNHSISSGRCTVDQHRKKQLWPLALLFRTQKICHSLIESFLGTKSKGNNIYIYIYMNIYSKRLRPIPPGLGRVFCLRRCFLEPCWDVLGTTFGSTLFGVYEGSGRFRGYREGV